MPAADQPNPVRPEAEEKTTSVGHFFHRAERWVYILVAALLLATALTLCGYGVVHAFEEARRPGQLTRAVFTLLSDLLLVLIVLELLRTVGRFIRKEEPGVGVADLTPFLVVGAISATRRLLAIGANLSITESQQASEHASHGGGTSASSFEPEHFRQAMIELGLNGGLILIITISLLLIGRHIPGGNTAVQGDEPKQAPDGQKS